MTTRLLKSSRKKKKFYLQYIKNTTLSSCTIVAYYLEKQIQGIKKKADQCYFE